MRPARPIRRLAATLALVGTVAAAAGAHAQVKVPIAGSDRWRIRYADSTLSINDFCPVAKRPLGEKQTPFYVNGRPVGFC